MTDNHPPTNPAKPPPTARQQRYLRQLALQRGITFTVPKTRAEASRAIAALKRRRPEPLADRRREIRAVQDDLAHPRLAQAGPLRQPDDTRGGGRAGCDGWPGRSRPSVGVVFGLDFNAGIGRRRCGGDPGAPAKFPDETERTEARLSGRCPRSH